jgi:hypothetical protein
MSARFLSRQLPEPLRQFQWVAPKLFNPNVFQSAGRYLEFQRRKRGRDASDGKPKPRHPSLF